MPRPISWLHMAIPLRSGHARRRSDETAAAAEFARWLNLTVVSLNTADGRRWSSRLANVMTEKLEVTDDSYLRRVAAGKRSPSLELTYRIGEGLRLAGLGWCSGTLALLRNPKYLSDALAVLDLASEDARTFASMIDWMGTARKLWTREMYFELRELRKKRGPEEFERAEVTFHRAELARLTRRAQERFRHGWDQYRHDGRLRRVHGPFGGLSLIVSDQRFAAVADQFCGAIWASLEDKLTWQQTQVLKDRGIFYAYGTLVRPPVEGKP